MKHRRFRKPYRVKRRRSILRNRFLWLAILFILLAGGFFYFICFSQTFEISEVRVSGNQKIQKTDLENAIRDKFSKKIFAVIPANNLLFLNLGKIEGEISEKFPLTAEVSLGRIFPDKLFLNIKERQPYGVWCKNDEPCFYFDIEGTIFEEISRVESDDLMIKNFTEGTSAELGKQVIEKNILESILHIEKSLKNNAQINTGEFIILSSERLNVRVIEGWEIYFNLNEDTNWQLTKLSSVLEEEISSENRGDLEYIDLRFSRVYYKYRE